MEQRGNVRLREEGWGVVGAAELMDNVLCNYILSV